MLCFPKNFIPWRDSNQNPLVPEADAISTAPRRQGRVRQQFSFVSKIKIKFLPDRSNQGVDVMITIFCDFCQFLAKKLANSQKPML
jgi:hypothetical protein